MTSYSYLNIMSYIYKILMSSSFIAWLLYIIIYNESVPKFLPYYCMVFVISCNNKCFSIWSKSIWISCPAGTPLGSPQSLHRGVSTPQSSAMGSSSFHLKDQLNASIISTEVINLFAFLVSIDFSAYLVSIDFSAFLVSIDFSAFLVSIDFSSFLVSWTEANNVVASNFFLRSILKHNPVKKNFPIYPISLWTKLILAFKFLTPFYLPLILYSLFRLSS